MSDPQKYKVYDSEREAFAGAPRFSWSSAAQLTKQLAYFHGIPLRGVDMLSRNSRWDGLAAGSRNSIAYPSRGASHWIVIHEIAHFLAFDSHGPKFCGVYLRLIGLHISEFDKEKLKVSFDKHGVKYNVG